MNKIEKAVVTYLPWIIGIVSLLVAFRMLAAGHGTPFIAYLCTGKLMFGIGCVTRLLGAKLDQTAHKQTAIE